MIPKDYIFAFKMETFKPESSVPPYLLRHVPRLYKKIHRKKNPIYYDLHNFPWAIHYSVVGHLEWM